MHAAKPDVLFEASSLNAETGEPAIAHVRAALHIGAHVVSANKGPIVHAYPELTLSGCVERSALLFRVSDDGWRASFLIVSRGAAGDSITADFAE